MYQKLIDNKSGFSLIEVLVGIMVLTVAIVAASNTLGTLVRSNENNMKAMQAYYLAQEGIEAVRNVRDSNWLHNSYWLGSDDGQPWGDKFEPGFSYDLQLRSAGWENIPDENISAESIAELSAVSPWYAETLWEENELADIYLHEGYLSSDKDYLGDGEESGFSRRVTIKEYDEDGSGCKNTMEETVCVLIESTVEWKIGARQRQVTVSAVVSDWKGDML